jgi:hypothetical protein
MPTLPRGRTLARLDPHRVFSANLLDRLMPRSADLSWDGVDGADLGAMLASWSSCS